MADCVTFKVDSNATGLSFAEEVCAKQLPTLADDGHDPTWYDQEPNSYNDFGGDIKTIARKPLNQSRQQAKGTAVDLDAAGGYNQDFTQHNTNRLLQGFFFANMREKPTTKPMNGDQIDVTSADNGTSTFILDEGGTRFYPGAIIYVSGPGVVNADNLGVFTVTDSTDTTIEVDATLVDETFSGEVIITLVGYEFDVGEVSLVAPADTATLTNTNTPVAASQILTIANTFNAVADETVTIGDRTYTWKAAAAAPDEVTIGGTRLVSVTNLTATINGGNLLTPIANADFVATDNADGTMTINARIAGTQFNSIATTETMTHGSWGAGSTAGGTGTSFALFDLIPGEWLFMGGDGTTDIFAENVGFARVGSLTATGIIFDKTTWAVSAVVAGALTVKLYFGSVLKNEFTPDLITTKYFQFERTLGQDEVGVQAEYLKGAVANEMTFNIETADKVTIDLGFMASDVEYRTGTEGVKAGSHIQPLGEDAYNTSSDVYRLRLSKVVQGNSYPDAFFGYVTKGTVTINNNVESIKAIAAFGGIDVNVGNFEVGGELTALFQNVGQNKSIRANDDITLDMIFAKQNHGYVFDIPLLALGGGRLDISENKPITVPLEQFGAKNSNNYTLLFTTFDYLPDVAMPVAV
jgi:hypothetical protein